MIKLLQFTYYNENFKIMTYITKPDYMFAIYNKTGKVQGESIWRRSPAINFWSENGTIL